MASPSNPSCLASVTYIAPRARPLTSSKHQPFPTSFQNNLPPTQIGQCQSLQVDRLLALLFQHHIDAFHQVQQFTCVASAATFARSCPTQELMGMTSKTSVLDAVEQKNQLCRNTDKPVCGHRFSSCSYNHESRCTHLESNANNSRCRHEPTLIPLSST